MDKLIDISINDIRRLQTDILLTLNDQFVYIIENNSNLTELEKMSYCHKYNEIQIELFNRSIIQHTKLIFIE